jgi:hypothetical protein
MTFDFKDLIISGVITFVIAIAAFVIAMAFL